MKNVIRKIKIISIMIVISFILFTPNTYGDDGLDFSIGFGEQVLVEANVIEDSKSKSDDDIINPDDYKPDKLTDAGQIKTIGNQIIGGIQFVGSIVSVIVLIIIGIKFIYGSAEEKAEYKESLKPYLIGAVMLFLITNILAIISSLFE